MPMSEFIEVVCNDASAPDNWADIFQEYQELIGDEKAMARMMLERNANFLATKIWLVEIAAALLNTDQYDRAKAWLATNGFRDESRVLSHLKTLRVQLKELETKLNTSTTNETAMTAADFESNLVALGRHNNGMDTTPKNISVARYCAMVKQLNEDIRQSEANGSTRRN